MSLKPAALERFNGLQLDARVLLFVFGVSLLTGIIFGIAPAWSVARADFATSIKEGGRSTTAGPSGNLLRKSLVTAEFALALVLLVGAGLLIKGFSHLRSVNPGFNPQGVMTMHLQLPATRYAEIPPQTQFRRAVLTRLNSLPGAQAAMVTDIPLGGVYIAHRIVIDGQPVPIGAEPQVQTLSLWATIFTSCRFPSAQVETSPRWTARASPLVAIVNEQFVKSFSRAQPDWRTHRLDKAPHPLLWMTIVGVAADVRHSDSTSQVEPAGMPPFRSPTSLGGAG